MKPPQLSLTADSSEGLIRELAAVDISVPPNGQGRTTQHREQYLMARFLATLADSDELQYPLKLLHREKPDFQLQIAGQSIGVECVEAVADEWKKICAMRDRDSPDALVFPQMLSQIIEHSAKVSR